MQPENNKKTNKRGNKLENYYEVLLILKDLFHLINMNRRQIFLFAPSLAMLLWAGHNFVKKLHHRQQEQTAMSQTRETNFEPIHSNSRMPASIPSQLPPVQIDKPLQKDEPSNELHLNLIEDRRDAKLSPCHFGDDCQQPNAESKSQDFEKLQDYAFRNCAGKALSNCDSVLGDLTLDHDNPMYIEARRMMTLSCENDTLSDCEKVSQLEEHEGNIDAARDYAEYSCSSGNMASCKHVALMEVVARK